MPRYLLSGRRTLLYVCLLPVCVSWGQTSSTARCQVLTTPLQVRAEGLTERLGDVNLQCSGSVPGSMFTGNFSLSLPVNVSNRVDSNNVALDAQILVDLGGGFAPTGIAGRVS